MPITDWDESALTESAVLVDVRTPAEYADGHLKGAVNIDFLAPDFSTEASRLDPSRTIYVYCKKGGRSARARALLDSLGYEKVIDLTGGYDAYRAASQNR